MAPSIYRRFAYASPGHLPVCEQPEDVPDKREQNVGRQTPKGLFHIGNLDGMNEGFIDY